MGNQTGLSNEDRAGRLGPHPMAGAALSASVGRSPLGLGAERDGLLHVPPVATSGGRLPLVVLLHGAGGDAAGMADLFGEAADEHGVLLVVPESRGRTWDVITRSGFGPDVAFLRRALAEVLPRCPVDTGRMAIGGFSDGASYALSLGITNGDLFGHVLAYSPGFAAPGTPVGRPALFLSHGTEDRVLPVERCSRRLVPALRDAGYEVAYREFRGGHGVPPDVLDASLRWFRDETRTHRRW
ncbi:alpha/beta hydrolase [Actinophytocola sp.]|uniref:alpha/beta hydrolase n=1 Tax=Actinophytocola sp. TaxID=1872138 RepID=UPI00389A6376